MKAVLQSLLMALSVILLGGCFKEPPPPECVGGKPAVSTGGSDAGPPDVGAAGQPDEYEGACPPGTVFRTAPKKAQCRQADTAEPLPQRDVVSDRAAAAVPSTYFTSDLFATFKANCGGCHVEGESGGFLVKTSTDFKALFDADVLARIKSDDPTIYMPPDGSGGKKWSERVDGDPIKSFVALVEQWMAAGSPTDFFTQPPEAGAVSRFFMEAPLAQAQTNLGNCIPDAELVNTNQESSCQTDARFAAMKKIEAPEPATPEQRIGLPLHLDQTDLSTFDSAELARNNVIAYAPTYPLWTDDAGKQRYLRVPIGESIRFDKKTQEFEIPENTRFYKTFMRKVLDQGGNPRWKKLETRVIVSRKDKPLFGTYVWDENETRAELLRDALRDGEPFRDRVILVVTDEQKAAEIRAKNPRNLTYELQRAGVLRHYAIPGRDRCIQCHMGSHSSSFVLGFTPLDVLRRPQGEGGVIEPAGPDELTQLDRLIDYGLITGIDSASDIKLLEDSQGDRKPRNEHELLAQSYLLGNCAHCHNPNGFPSQQAPELAKLLDFFPSPEGGIFQFPLDRVSPRLHRGLAGDVELPYITPSLYDIMPEVKTLWKPKYQVDQNGSGTLNIRYLEAPWRSLIWRNTDNPFPYAEDYVIYPHMPMNSPGFDCRAQQLLGDWMVSIPAKRKDPTLWEQAVELPENSPIVAPGAPDRGSQPYVEVEPGEPDYDKAVKDAQARFEKWRKGNRYGHCADTSDIVDLKVVDGERLVPLDGEIYALKDYIENDSVPDRPHWIETDLTELPPPWYPRRLDWKELLVDGTFPMLDPGSRSYDADLQKQNELRNVVDLIQQSQLSAEFRTYATTPIPFGLWQKKAGCDFSTVPKLSQLPSKPAWVDPTLPGDTPVFMATPGAAVYGTICINCHGTQADSQGIQAQKVAELTGGNTRVANFVKGLFGPPDDVFANRQRIFSEQSVVTPDTMAARYMAFMGLGGTAREIPRPVLNLIAQATVMGLKRPTPLAVEVSANMLAVAEELCRVILHPTGGTFRLKVDDDRASPLIKEGAGELELWTGLCRYGNSRMIRVVDFIGGDNPRLTFNAYNFYDASKYPADAPVGIDGGVEATLTATNDTPWCIRPPTEPKMLADAQALASAKAVNGKPLPFCPAALMSSSMLEVAVVDNWAKRGAINAGFAVYTYLDELVHGRANKVRYNECELIGK